MTLGPRDLNIALRDAVFALQCKNKNYAQRVWVNPDDWKAMIDYANETSVGAPLYLPPPKKQAPVPEGCVGMVNGAPAFIDTALERGTWRIDQQEQFA